MTHTPKRIIPIAEKSLNELEGVPGPSAPFKSDLIASVAAARQIPVDELNPSQLRLLVTQRQGINFIFGRVLGLLEEDPWLDSGYYPGDLLIQVAQIDRALWPRGEEWVARLTAIFRNALGKSDGLDEVSRNTGMRDSVIAALEHLSK